MSVIIVIAKAPTPGRVKTRLCPPCTPEQAAALAGAALADTLAAVAAAGADRRVIVLDGEPGAWLPEGFEVVAQRGRGLDERLAAAFADAHAHAHAEPALLVGMDTPQVTAPLLDHGLGRLAEPEVDAVLGGALDGGYWAVGLRRPDARVFRGVPMSLSRTGEAQRARLRSLGLALAELPELRDVDDVQDACAVAREAPGTRFAAQVAAILPSARAA